MGNNTVLISGLLLMLTLIPLVVDNAFADSKNYVTAEDLGVLQLAAHDLFNVDRCNGDASCSEDFENGKLDLSTLLVDTVNGGSFDDATIAIGGEPRNRENIMLFTIASEFGETYVNLKEKFGELKAKKLIIEKYHKKLAKSYKKAFHENFPSPMDGAATMQENLALRTIHDLLPGQIKINNNWVSTLDSSLHGLTLDKNELQQKSSKLDGKFDAEYLNIMICFPPDLMICINVNLLKADQSFGEQFETPISFNFFMEELEDGLYDKNDWGMFHIRNLMAKGQNF